MMIADTSRLAPYACDGIDQADGRVTVVMEALVRLGIEF
jgi:hypothetical protein